MLQGLAWLLSAHCYAEAYTGRMAGRPGWIEEHRPWTPANAGHNVRLHPERLDQPLRWRKSRMVFVNSMSDLFHEEIPDEFIVRVFAAMVAAPQHTFQVLTKRPERMLAVLNSGVFPLLLGDALRAMGRDPDWHPFEDAPVAPNVWLGVSIENRRFVYRADLLRRTPAAVRFISAEPLLGPLVYDLPLGELDGGSDVWRDGYRGPDLDLTGIDWLITGGESGPEARRFDPQWARDLRDACQQEDVAYFHKQNGGRTAKAGGRLLDGRTWDEMPAGASA